MKTDHVMGDKQKKKWSSGPRNGHVRKQPYIWEFSKIYWQNYWHSKTSNNVHTDLCSELFPLLVTAWKLIHTADHQCQWTRLRAWYKGLLLKQKHTNSLQPGCMQHLQMHQRVNTEAVHVVFTDGSHHFKQLLWIVACKLSPLTLTFCCISYHAVTYKGSISKHMFRWTFY